MLTFEFEANHEAVFIHADVDGLRQLANNLLKLADQVEANGNDHMHFMTPAWGGHELSEAAQSKTSSIVNHVKVFGWRDAVK